MKTPSESDILILIAHVNEGRKEREYRRRLKGIGKELDKHFANQLMLSLLDEIETYLIIHQGYDMDDMCRPILPKETS